MKSWEVLKEATEQVGVKALAAQLKLSPALVYKWCQESARDDPDSSGTRNPLDRLAEIVSATGNPIVVHWLCHEAGGFFVHNPAVVSGCPDTVLLKTAQQLVQEFSDLLAAVSNSIEDGAIQPAEADTIRQKWEQLKSGAESFVVAGEAGCYAGD